MRALLQGSAIAVCAISSAGADVLDKPSFTAQPSELLAAAKVATVDADIVVLRDETSIDFDAKGRARRRYRVVFAVRKQAGVDSWGTLALNWEPFYQDKPVIRARVIAPNGQVSELDASLINDAPSVSESPSVFSDRRELEAPLPRLAVGAVVEEEYVVADRAPLLAAGSVEIERVGRYVPVRRTLVAVSAPATLAVRIVPRGFAKPPTPRVSKSNDRSSWVYDFGAMDAQQRGEEGVPGDHAEWPTIGVATGASWGAVAREYQRIVDERLGQGGFTPPDDVKAATQHDTLERAVKWLHTHVRYTGIEFSDAAIVPWPPAEVVKRGFGDCKDKASLLVAMLRAEGIRADVALLSTGPGRDVDRDLPGLGDFDHAIVRAKIDGKDAWIDATEDDLPAGQLPARDQGRLALIASAETTQLVATPMSAPVDNVVREVRTYHLAEYDQGSVVEVTHESGVYSNNLRSWVRGSRHDAIDKNLHRYVEDVYHGKLASFSTTDPDDLSKPFTLTVEAHDVARAFTKRQQIDVYLFPADTLGRIPYALDKHDHDEERRADFVWSHPHVYEIENRLVVPSGYTMPQLRPHDQEVVGTMVLTTDRKIENDTIVVTYRLDTQKLRLSPKEVADTRTAVGELRKRDGEHVMLAHTAWALAHQGKLVEAIAECQRLIALHPKEALHWDQLADIYRTAGMGPAARRAARKAVDIQPTADAYDVLAFQLRHDTQGHDLGYDMDRKGAIAAYRKALEINPKHIGALEDFATLLLADEHGHITLDKRDRTEAIALYRRANEATNRHDYDRQIVGSLLLLGQLAEAETTARAMPESNERSALLVAATAAARGASAAIDLAGSLGSEQRKRQLLDQASSLLVLMRRYDVARALFDEAKDASTDGVRAAAMARLAPVDPAKIDAADPRTPALQMFLAISGDTTIGPAPWTERVGSELKSASSALHAAVAMRQFHALPRAIVIDLVAAVEQTSIEGSASTGWRVTVDIGPAKMHLYVVDDHHRATVIAASDVVGDFGEHVLSLLAKGDRATASRWIKWAAEDGELPGNPTAFHAFAAIYRNEEAHGDKDFPSKDFVELAAAMLGATSQPKIAIPILRRCSIMGDDVKKACLRRLGSAYAELKRWTEAAEVARALSELEPTEAMPVVLRADALALGGHAADARKLLEDALAKSPDSLPLIRERGHVAIAARDWHDAAAWLDKLIDHPAATVSDMNGAAWLHLFFDSSPDDARKIAARGERMQRSPSPMFANTIAAIEAELDHPYTAWTHLEKSLATSTDGKPRPADWYVIGRIAETYGLRDDAIAAYRQVAKPTTEHVDPSDFEFVKRRLDKLGVR